MQDEIVCERVRCAGQVDEEQQQKQRMGWGESEGADGGET